MGQAAAFGQASFNRILDQQVTALGVRQEDKTHDRHEVFVAGIVGIGTQRIRSVPKVFFNGFYVFKLGHGLG